MLLARRLHNAQDGIDWLPGKRGYRMLPATYVTKRIRECRRDIRRVFEQVDVLVSPSTPTTAFPLGERVDDPLAMYVADLCTIPSDLAGNAALSVPCGLAAEDGLPVGLQIMAPVLADDRVYRVGAAVEAALDSRRGHPLLDDAKGLG